jgi:ABC-2 type transport system permease protein
MSKTTLIFQREFLTRVKKKTFLIMTIVGPLLLSSLISGTAAYWQACPMGPKTIVVVDESGIDTRRKGQ